MQNNQFEPVEDLDMLTLLKIFAESWRWIAACVVAGGGIAITTIILSPTIYEAVAIFQVAQDGQVGQSGQVNSVLVEAPQTAIERIRTGAFQIEAANNSGYSPWIKAIKHQSKLGEQFYSLQIIKNTNLIEIRARSDSNENSKKIIIEILKSIAKRHDELAAPSLQRMRSELGLAKEKLEITEKESIDLKKLLELSRMRNEQFSQFTLLTSVKQVKESELFAQRQLIVALNIALAKPATQPTKALEEVYITDEPISPDKWKISILGLLGGLFFGLFPTLMRHFG